jgi:hypothetical protein
MVNHLRHGLRQLSGLPDSLQRKRRELALQTALGQGLAEMVAGDEEGHEAFKRARELSRELNETDQLGAMAGTGRR